MHRLEQLHGTVGTQIFTRSAYDVLKTLRQDLKAIGVQEADQVTLESFRAGKAPDMVANKEPLGKILEFGEWRSSVLLAYISETAVDSLKVVQNEVAQELDDEEE